MIRCHIIQVSAGNGRVKLEAFVAEMGNPNSSTLAYSAPFDPDDAIRRRTAHSQLGQAVHSYGWVAIAWDDEGLPTDFKRA